MKFFRTYSIVIGCLSVLFLSCEDVVPINVQEGKEQLVVDAWLTDSDSLQVVQLSLSQPYFSKNAIQPASGATVLLIDEDSLVYNFSEIKGTGKYVYDPKVGIAAFRKENKRYSLYITYEGSKFMSSSVAKRVPKIDSIAYQPFEFPIALSDTLPKSGFIAQFYARDFSGLGDTYWIKFRKNGRLINRPDNMILAYDGGFSSGSQSDGILFITPIRQSINERNVLYQHNDVLDVEILSIPLEAFYFLQSVRQESTNAGIFSTPSNNIPTNILSLSSSNKLSALGFFCVSKTQRFSTTIDKAKAKEKL